MIRNALPPEALTRSVFTRAEAIKAGWTARSIRTQVSNGAWKELASGRYADMALWKASNPVESHRLLAIARALGSDVVLAGGSAAAVHGLSALYSSVKQVTLHRNGRLNDADIVAVDGVHVISPTLTVVDCARRYGVEPGLVVADSALRRGITSKPQLEEMLDRFTKQPGTRAAGVVLKEADGRAATPIESVSRWRFLGAGLPRPELQFAITINDRTYYTDFGWQEQRTVGESDGITKYDEDGLVIRDEKLRHGTIEDAEYLIARWIWDEIWYRPTVVVARVWKRFDEARKRFGL